MVVTGSALTTKAIQGFLRRCKKRSAAPQDAVGGKDRHSLPRPNGKGVTAAERRRSSYE